MTVVPLTTTFVAGPPKFTVSPGWKPVPVILTVTSPSVGPVSGSILFTVNASGAGDGCGGDPLPHAMPLAVSTPNAPMTTTRASVRVTMVE